DALSAADAQRRDPEASIARRHGVEQSDEDTGTARADRMSERYGTTVHVDPVLGQLQLALDTERLRGERLVQLPEVDLLLAQTGPLERLLRRRPGAHAHDRRVDAGRGVAADRRQRRQAELLRLAVGHDHDRGAAVVDARGVAGGDAASVGLEGRTQWLQLLRRRAGARMLVDLEPEGFALLRTGDLDRHDLILEVPALDGGGRLLLALGRELVLLLAADAVLRGDVLRRDAHVDERDRAGEPVGDHRVEQLIVSHADTETRLLQDVRRPAHALHAPRDDDVRVAQGDCLRGEHSRL